MVMKIINPRGAVFTADDFKKKFSMLVANAVEASNVESFESSEKHVQTNQEKLRQEAAKKIQSIGMDTSTKEGQAAAGATLFTDAIAAGFQEYERKTGKTVPREAMMRLEKVLAQFAVPPRGKVQDIRNVKVPWKQE
jgi:hypothetical protein